MSDIYRLNRRTRGSQAKAFKKASVPQGGTLLDALKLAWADAPMLRAESSPALTRFSLLIAVVRSEIFRDDAKYHLVQLEPPRTS